MIPSAHPNYVGKKNDKEEKEEGLNNIEYQEYVPASYKLHAACQKKIDMDLYKLHNSYICSLVLFFK